MNKKVLLIWGKNDQVIPYENHRQVLHDIPQAEFISLNDAGHMPHFEVCEKLCKRVSQFIKD